LPALTILPAFWIGSVLLRFVVLLPSLFFFVWNPGLFDGDEEIPQRSYALFVGSLLLNLAWISLSWSGGVRYQGRLHVFIITAINVVWVLVLTFLALVRLKRKPTFRTSVVFHWTLFAWLGWYAFPYFGELL
jgi:hypothetical protein